MRVFNMADLRGDIHLHLSALFHNSNPDRVDTYTSKVNARELVFMSWIERAWVKHLIKTAESRYIWPVQVRTLPSFFKSSSASNSPQSLEVEIPKFGKLELDPQTEWDVKDAEAGTLFYYAPSDATLSRFYEEINDVRDYVYTLIDAGESLDKRSYTDAKRASDRWHEEQARALRARLEAEAAMRAAADKARAEAVPRWDFLSQSRDWDFAIPNPVEVHGTKYVLLRLTSQQALDYESYVMQHCVHSYGNRLTSISPQIVLISVRALDSAHLPLVTAELWVYPDESEAAHIIQVRGKYNHEAEQTIKGIRQTIEQLKQEIAANARTFRRISTDLSFRIQ